MGQHAPGNYDTVSGCVGFAYEYNAPKMQMCPAACNDHSFYNGDGDPEDEGAPAGYSASVYGIADNIPSEKCMIFCEIQRDGGSIGMGELVSHEVAHCLGLSHSEYVDSFEDSKDGIMGWNKPLTTSCWKDWFDLVWDHTSPDRFSYYHISYLRGSATD